VNFAPPADVCISAPLDNEAIMSLPEFIQSLLSHFNIGAQSGSALARIILAVIVLIISWIAFRISRRIVADVVHRIFKRTRFTWDDVLQENKLFMRLTLIVPVLIIHVFIPLMLDGYPQVEAVAAGAVTIYFIIVAFLVLDALINSLHAIYQTFRVSRDIPLKGFTQVLKIVLFCTGLIMVISVILDRSPIYLLSGLGAMTAVLMLIFKDPILGFVAGIQLISNRMLKHGDWIEMPRYNADGDVIDITLTTVKVRNWDKTITTIPTYALINDSFKNWRGMQESQGRRIKRSIYIDMNTITFCTPRMLERFATIRYISDYMQRKHKELEAYNAERGIDKQDATNARRLTNIGTFRAYVHAYLQNHPMINTTMTFLVRQLAPTQHGLPLEIYVFCKDKTWANYEAVQSDIFDHLLAIAGEFDLKVYQYPSGTDILRLSGGGTGA
jgi:miniconductance mechanosensitive channel